MQSMLCSKHEVTQGSNVVVRRGVKWAAQDNEEVYITFPDDPKRDGAYRISTRIIRFSDLQELDVPGKLLPEVLVQMREWYPGFDPREIVTLVEFDV